jgi:spermidine synthase
VWTTELHEMLLIGSFSPIELNVARIAARFNQPDVSSALSAVGVGSPEALLATWVTDRAGLERYAAGAPAVTDDRPRIEYGPWALPGEFEQALKNLLDLRTDPPLIGADAAERAAVANQRTILLSFYEAAIYAYHGEGDKWKATLTWVMDRDPDNPYFRSFRSVDAFHSN